MQLRPGCLQKNKRQQYNGGWHCKQLVNSRGTASLTHLSQESSRKLTQPRPLCVTPRLHRSCPAVRSRLSGDLAPEAANGDFSDAVGQRVESGHLDACERTMSRCPLTRLHACRHARIAACLHSVMPGPAARRLADTGAHAVNIGNGPSPCSGQAPGDARRNALTETYSAAESPATGRSCINRLGKEETPSRINPCPLESPTGIVWYKRTSYGRNVWENNTVICGGAFGGEQSCRGGHRNFQLPSGNEPARPPGYRLRRFPGALEHAVQSL